jgi:hypothetical protein
MVDDTISMNKNLFVVSLNFEVAFGSVSQYLIKYSLKCAAFNKEMAEMVFGSYAVSSSNVCMTKGQCEEIEMCRGLRKVIH